MKSETLNKLSRSIHKVGFKFKKHSPEILTGAGIVCVVASTVMACKATTKLSTILEDTQEQAPVAPENEETEGDKNEALTEEEIREELQDMKKDELIKVAVESGLDEAEMKELKKAEIIDKIVELTKEA